MKSKYFLGHNKSYSLYYCLHNKIVNDEKTILCTLNIEKAKLTYKYITGFDLFCTELKQKGAFLVSHKKDIK